MNRLKLKSKIHTPMCFYTHSYAYLTHSLSRSHSVYDDDDLRELRASMERLLQEQRSDEDDDEEEEDVGGSNGSPVDEESAGVNGLEGAGENPSPETPLVVYNGTAEEHDDVSHDEEEPGELVTDGMEVEEDEEQNSSEGQLNEEWHSGNHNLNASETNCSRSRLFSKS